MVFGDFDAEQIVSEIDKKVVYEFLDSKVDEIQEQPIQQVETVLSEQVADVQIETENQID